MLSHVHIGVNDFARACAFYAPLMAELGLVLKFCDDASSMAGWVAPDAPRPLFLVGKPYNGEPATPGNGQMVALLAASRDAVMGVHALALKLGATSEGAPGLRPHYHPDYFGGYLRDPEGNKLSIVCHGPQA